MVFPVLSDEVMKRGRAGSSGSLPPPEAEVGSFSPQTTAIIPVGFVHAGIKWCFARAKLYFLSSLSKYQVS